MSKLFVTPIGKISINEDGMFVKVDPVYIPALQELDGFSHLNVMWWFDGCDNEHSRNVLEVEAPYKKSPAIMGTFATRSPERPNPIAISVCQIIYIDHDKGIIQLAYIDANDNSPIIDLKPYVPSIDRVENPGVPEWCAHWPKCNEDSGYFDWESEFNF